MSREAALPAFLAANGFADAMHDPLPVDCSFRSYSRLHEGPRPALLMNAPPGLEPLEPFIAIARHLRDLGLSAPSVFAADLTLGYALIEDFGDATFTRRLDAGASHKPLYTLAVDALIALQTNPRMVEIDVPAYDLDRLMAEALLFLDWYWPAIHGAPPTGDARAAYETMLRGLLQPIADGPKTLVLRDFHVDNLMTLEGREGVAACGLLDFQDAVLGHPAYDLASLLQDARRNVDAALAEAMRERYAAAVPQFADDRAYYVLAVQRHLKVLGIFTRLSRRDGKSHQLHHCARLWRLIDECVAAEPVLKPLGDWLAHHWPPETRIVPPLPGAP
jgi:aminoglycoside/choline kinase family phosphotransferase